MRPLHKCKHSSRLILALLLVLSLAIPSYGGVDFDATDGYIDLGTSVIGDSDYCGISFWFKINSAAGNWEDIFGRGQDGAGDGWSIKISRIDSTNFMRVATVYDTGGAQQFNVYSTNTITDNNWHHIFAEIRHTDGQRIVLDGTDDQSIVPTKGVLRTSTVGTRIGWAGGNTGDVEITEVAIFHYATTTAQLSNADIALLANSRIKGMPLQISQADVTLKAYYPMDFTPAGNSINGITFRDLSGNSYNGTGSDAGGESITMGETVLSYPPGVIAN